MSPHTAFPCRINCRDGDGRYQLFCLLGDDDERLYREMCAASEALRGRRLKMVPLMDACPNMPQDKQKEFARIIKSLNSIAR